MWLARLCTQLAPESAEAGGLLALLLHCEARRHARRDADGGYVSLSEQDTSLWDASMIGEAEAILRRALARRSHGRFQLEAAIQSVHAARPVTGRTDWAAATVLYERLVAIAPTLGALVGRAAAIAEAVGPDAGITALADIPEERIKTYQPYWATRAHLLAKAGRADEARTSFDRAIGLSEEPAVRAFLQKAAAAAAG